MAWEKHERIRMEQNRSSYEKECDGKRDILNETAFKGVK